MFAIWGILIYKNFAQIMIQREKTTLKAFSIPYMREVKVAENSIISAEFCQHECRTPFCLSQI